MADENGNIGPIAGFKVKIKDSSGTEKFLQKDSSNNSATWGPSGVDFDSEWRHVDNCGECPGCLMRQECDFPEVFHLCVSGENVVFGASAESWTLTGSKLCHSNGNFLEVSGTSLVVGSSGHEVSKTR